MGNPAEEKSLTHPSFLKSQQKPPVTQAAPTMLLENSSVCVSNMPQPLKALMRGLYSVICVPAKSKGDRLAVNWSR